MESLAAVAKKIAAGEESPRGLVEQALGRIAEREPNVQAWVHLDAEGARSQAALLEAELAQSGSRGPLHGIPCAVKDIFDVAGMPCEWGSAVMRGRRPSADSALVAELRRSGAIIVGKTVTTAFAYFDAGPTRNPHNLEHTPGGSSSGSAAAVAEGMVPVALGSQTMGSVLRPASFCGVVGFKPSFGALPLEGVMPFAPSLDHAGLFTRTVEDMVTVWGALRRVREARPVRRVATLRWPIAGELEPEMAEGYARALDRFRASGVEIIEYEPPEAFRALPEAIPLLMAREAVSIHGELLDRHGDALGVKLAALLERGRAVSDADYAKSKSVIAAARKAYAALTAEHPVVLTPAALGPAPRGLSSTGDPAATPLGPRWAFPRSDSRSGRRRTAFRWGCS